jgi:UDP-N-acetylglucosamine:LPS N-acetylglucosamine transferase
MEGRLVRRQGLPYRAVPAAGLHGVGPLALPGNGWQLAKGVRAAAKIIREFRPDALFFTGGFVGVPAAIAGWRRPSVTFVPDIEPAMAQRLIAWTADRVCVTTDDSRRYYRRRSGIRVTGYPSRFAGRTVDRDWARRQLDLTDGVPVLVVMGGSKGAHSINRAVWRSLDQLLPSMYVIHVTGERDWPQVEPAQSGLSPALGRRYRPHAYLHEEMEAVLAAADLVVSRAGASSIGEYPLFDLPSVLVPYPHAWRYQRVNAAYMADRGAAVVVADDELDVGLVPAVMDLFESRAKRSAMAEAAGRLAKPLAARAIADEILAVGGSGEDA